MLVVLLGFEFVRITVRDEAAGDNNTHSQTLKLTRPHDTMYPDPGSFLSPRREYQVTDKEAARENLW